MTTTGGPRQLHFIGDVDWRTGKVMISREAMQFLRDLWRRTGGDTDDVATAATTSNWSGVVDDDGNKPADNAIATVGQLDIDTYAVARVSTEVQTSTATNGVSINSGSFVEIDRISLTLPSDVTNSAVMVDFSFDLWGNDGSSSTGQSSLLFGCRLLDDDDATVADLDFRTLAIRNDVVSGSRLAGSSQSYSFLVAPANLNGGAANTFKVQVRGQAGWTTLEVNNWSLRATLLNQAN